MTGERVPGTTSRSGKNRPGRPGRRTTRTRSGQDSGLPAYLHIANAISERIASGTFRGGDQLPTEARLREEFGVSPMTVRRAINILLDRGLVTTIQGKGTFVRGLDLGEAVFRLQELADQWADSSVEVTLLEASIVKAEEQVAARLHRPPGSPTVFLRRLLSRRGSPLMYQREYVIYDERRPLVEAQMQITSVEGLLRPTGGEGLPAGDISIQAVSLDREAAELLGLPEGSPAFGLEHVFEDFDGEPVSWGWFLCRPDQFRLSTRIGAGHHRRRREDESGQLPWDRS